jgi:hypothetical protein
MSMYCGLCSRAGDPNTCLLGPKVWQLTPNFLRIFTHALKVTSNAEILADIKVIYLLLLFGFRKNLNAWSKVTRVHCCVSQKSITLYSKAVTDTQTDM